jgi:two-component system LytT family response regulator
MRVALIEDEPLAMEKLEDAIRAARSDIAVLARLGGVGESVAWLEKNAHPDLIFCDVQLSDGLAFEIFQKVRVRCPVVFTTAFDDYVLEAFASNGIDYLLKPLRRDRVAAALEKHARLKDFFQGDYSALAARPKFRERLLVRKGADFVPVAVADVAYFFAAQKLVFMVTRAGTRFMLDKALSEVEAELQPGRFFRANRAFLVQIEAVRRCRPFHKGKLLLEVEPAFSGEIVVSQERAGAFKEWLGQ